MRIYKYTFYYKFPNIYSKYSNDFYYKFYDKLK